MAHSQRATWQSMYGVLRTCLWIASRLCSLRYGVRNDVRMSALHWFCGLPRLLPYGAPRNDRKIFNFTFRKSVLYFVCRQKCR